MALANENTLENMYIEEEEKMEKSYSGFVKNLVMNQYSSSHSSPSSSNSSGFMFQASNYQQEAHSLINFKSGYDHMINANGSLLSFGQNDHQRVPHNTDQYSVWEDDHQANQNYQWNHQINPKCSSSTDPREMEDLNSFQTANSYGSINNTTAKEIHGDSWLYSDATIVADSMHESGSQDANFHKRSRMGESMQALKKQCTSSTATTTTTTTSASENKKPKPKSALSKDPQSIAAKNRRERISERLKILQELVPNGSKVDLVTMLEKAISYVKFLQLQVKVLATDEFWPVQGGKAPDISQVKEAIDAILSSQRDKTSSSKQ